MSALMSQTVGRARGFMSGFTSGQRSVVIVGVLALILGAVALTRWVTQPTWTPLYGNLSGTDANAVVQQLQSDGVQYKLADGGATVLVPQGQVYNERVTLAGKGLPSSSTTGDGWSLLDKQGITTTDFQQNVAYQRALEGELAKTLQSVSGVNTAVVHLAIPKKDVFSDDKTKTTASVLLDLQPGVTLTQSQVRAITHLVSGAVPELDAGDVTVTDQKGDMLSSPDGSADAAAGVAEQTDQQTAQYEDRISGALQQMLDKVVGSGHSVVRVNAQLNFDSNETVTKRYISDTGMPPLSQATVNERYVGAGNGSGGALGQVAPSLTPIAGATGDGYYTREQNTQDNAVGESTDHVVAAPGQVQRLTVAVALDRKYAAQVNSAQLQSLVSNAVGLDPNRGDTLQVTALPFDTTAAAAAQKEIAAAQSAAKTAQYITLGKKAGLGLLVLIALVIAMRRRKKDGTRIDAMASSLPPEPIVVQEPLAITAKAEQQLAARKEELEAEMGRERMREEVTALVDNQPEDVAQMLQGWLSERRS